MAKTSMNSEGERPDQDQQESRPDRQQRPPASHTNGLYLFPDPGTEEVLFVSRIFGVSLDPAAVGHIHRAADDIHGRPRRQRSPANLSTRAAAQRHQLSRARFSAAAAGWRDAGIARGLRRTAALPQLLGDLVRALRARAAGIRRVCRDPRGGYGWTGAADD